jgi:uncharacterized protein YndB with AHSA1/START domain
VVVASDRSWTFDRRPETVWAALADTDAYRTWWPWLRHFDARALRAGDVWDCQVKPPLPYSLRFTIAIEELHAPTMISATLDGDLRGAARIDLAPHGGGTMLRLRSELQPASRPIAVLSTLAGPITRWGHDWVLDTGARQFADRGLV